MLTTFPNRTWFQTEDGKWASRNKTRRDTEDEKQEDKKFIFRKFQRDLANASKTDDKKLRRKG